MKYSHNDEQQYIDGLITTLQLQDTTYVDIGASDGIEMSNTYFLAQRGWQGICVEYNQEKYNALIRNYGSYTNVKCMHRKATPDTVLDILDGNIPKTFSFLNLDIDGYDYFVLDKLLSNYRPTIICTEINEKIPPPIKFTVLYSDSYYWSNALFFGQSISQVQQLCNDHNYSIINVEYNNVFLINNDIQHSFTTLSPLDAWTNGYFNKSDRTRRFSHNNGFEPIYKMPVEEAVAFINNVYNKHQGQYKIEIGDN